MKKLIAGLLLGVCVSAAFGQTFPVNNLTVAGTSNFAGQSTFTLSPTGPTPGIGDSTTKLATTAFVTGNFVPLSGLAGLAPINSPTFTGIPAAPTASFGTNTTQLVTTAFVAQSKDCPSIMDYAGINTGMGDNSTAFNAVVAAQTSGKVCVYFPPGNYAFTNSISYTFPSSTGGSITIKGAGADLTNLTFNKPSASLLTIIFQGPYNSAHVRDMTIASAIAASSNTGLFFSQGVSTVSNPANSALSDVTGVTFRGADGYVVTDGWSTGVLVSSVSNVNFTNDVWVGPSAGTVGVLLQGTSTALGVVYQFQGCTFNYINIGIEYAQWVQGVTVAQSNFTGGVDGILTPASQAGLDELLVYGNQFNVSGNGIFLSTGVESAQIFGNIFLVPNSANGIFMSFAGNNVIANNTFEPANGSPAGNNGLVISGTINNWPNVITGNSFNQMKSDGIQLGSGSTGNNVQSNAYFGNGTNIVNAGSGNTIGGGSP